jgi:hypothetical protein
MASVAMLLFWSVMSASMSMLQLVTAIGCVMATRLSVRTATTQRDAIKNKLNELVDVAVGNLPGGVSYHAADRVHCANRWWQTVGPHNFWPRPLLHTILPVPPPRGMAHADNTYLLQKRAALLCFCSEAAAGL